MIQCRNSNRFPRFRRSPVTFKRGHSNYWPSQKRGHQQNCHATVLKALPCYANYTPENQHSAPENGGLCKRVIPFWQLIFCRWFSFWFFWTTFYNTGEVPGWGAVIPCRCCRLPCQLLGIPNDLNHKCFLISWNWTDWKQESPEIRWLLWGQRGKLRQHLLEAVNNNRNKTESPKSPKWWNPMCVL